MCESIIRNYKHLSDLMSLHCDIIFNHNARIYKADSFFYESGSFSWNQLRLIIKPVKCYIQTTSLNQVTDS